MHCVQETTPGAHPVTGECSSRLRAAVIFALSLAKRFDQKWPAEVSSFFVTSASL